MRRWENAQHRYSTRFAAMLQNTLHVFVARVTVPLFAWISILQYCNQLLKDGRKRGKHKKTTTTTTAETILNLYQFLMTIFPED